jgi:hypothetical protein
LVFCENIKVDVAGQLTVNPDCIYFSEAQPKLVPNADKHGKLAIGSERMSVSELSAGFLVLWVLLLEKPSLHIVAHFKQLKYAF